MINDTMEMDDDDDNIDEDADGVTLIPDVPGGPLL